MSRATDAELQKYFLSRKDIFDGKQVRASHILLKVDPAATSADKEKVKQKIMAIRDEIMAKKIGFADAANKYSEDEMGGNKNGGDLDFFPRRGKYLDVFADAAFALKKGEISAPVLTEYGWHLIQQTDVLPGKPVDLAQIKERVIAQYAQELNDAIVDSERAKAKIDVKPLPTDLFPKAVPPAPADAVKGAPATKGEAPKR
jgi:parvulin-like peptidyl-prolyl isomerase